MLPTTLLRATAVSPTSTSYPNLEQDPNVKFEVYAASALAGNSVLRSILGGTLPLAGPSMYARLGPHWAGTLLAFIQIAIIPIPVVFYMYGAKIRVKSVLIKAMQEDKEKLESKRRSGITVAKRNNEEEEIVKIASRPAQP